MDVVTIFGIAAICGIGARLGWASAIAVEDLLSVIVRRWRT